jgi:hypothetical protein
MAVLEDMNASTTRRSLGLVAALAALSVGAPCAGAAGIDPAIYETGVPSGQVEHGVISLTISGSPAPMSRRIEYWVTADRWRSQTTDTKTGKLIAGDVHDSSGTTWLQYEPVNGDPRVIHFKGNDSVPGAGFPAPYNRKIVETGVTEGPDDKPIKVTLQPTGPRTIAGFKGTAYEQLFNGRSGLVRVGAKPDDVDSHMTIVLQDGTFQPLLREVTADNGKWGTFDQREVLLSRETIPIAQADVQLTKRGFARTVTKWKAKVKAAKAAAKKKHHKK